MKGLSGGTLLVLFLRGLSLRPPVLWRPTNTTLLPGTPDLVISACNRVRLGDCVSPSSLGPLLFSASQVSLAVLLPDAPWEHYDRGPRDPETPNAVVEY